MGRIDAQPRLGQISNERMHAIAAGNCRHLFFEFGDRTGSDQHMDLSSLITLEQEWQCSSSEKSGTASDDVCGHSR